MGKDEDKAATSVPPSLTQRFWNSLTSKTFWEQAAQLEFWEQGCLGRWVVYFEIVQRINEWKRQVNGNRNHSRIISRASQVSKRKVSFEVIRKRHVGILIRSVDKLLQLPQDHGGRGAKAGSDKSSTTTTWEHLTILVL